MQVAVIGGAHVIRPGTVSSRKEEEIITHSAL